MTSITKARTLAASFGDAEIEGISPYGKHKTDTCEQGCAYCKSGVGKGGRESKEVKRAITKSSYSNTQTLDVDKLEVGDTIFEGTTRLIEDLGDNTCKPKYARYKPGRVFAVSYLRGSKKGKLGEVHFPHGARIAVVR